MATMRDTIVLLLHTIGAILVFRGSTVIDGINTFIENNPLIVIGIGLMLIIFGADVTARMVK